MPPGPLGLFPVGEQVGKLERGHAIVDHPDSPDHRGVLQAAKPIQILIGNRGCQKNRYVGVC